MICDPNSKVVNVTSNRIESPGLVPLPSMFVQIAPSNSHIQLFGAKKHHKVVRK